MAWPACTAGQAGIFGGGLLGAVAESRRLTAKPANGEVAHEDVIEHECPTGRPTRTRYPFRLSAVFAEQRTGIQVGAPSRGPCTETAGSRPAGRNVCGSMRYFATRKQYRRVRHPGRRMLDCPRRPAMAVQSMPPKCAVPASPRLPTRKVSGCVSERWATAFRCDGDTGRIATCACSLCAKVWRN